MGMDMDDPDVTGACVWQRAGAGLSGTATQAA